MYNSIPPERMSRRTIILTLFACITLLSVLIAGYFATFPQGEEDYVVPEEKPEESAVFVPVFSSPLLVQIPFDIGSVDDWETPLLKSITDWRVANTDAEYCVNLLHYAQDPALRQTRPLAQDAMQDLGVRTALLAYFGVSSEQEIAFFDGIASVVDADDSFAINGPLCSSGNFGRKFLLFEDQREVLLENGEVDLWFVPEVLEWTSAGWIMYPAEEYQVMDGYFFLPDWNGKVLVMTGYGDAGTSHWEVQELLHVDGVPASILLEQCRVVPVYSATGHLLPPEKACETLYQP